MKLAGAVVLCCLLTGCATTAPRSGSPRLVATQVPVVLSIHVDGQVSCGNYGGCRPSVVIRPDPAGTPPAATLTVDPDEEIVVPSIPHGGPCLCIWDVGARASQPTRTLSSGRYVAVGVVDTISDVVDLDPTPPDRSPPPFDVIPQCFATFDVAAGGSVSLAVRFKAEASCSIKATSEG